LLRHRRNVFIVLGGDIYPVGTLDEVVEAVLAVGEAGLDKAAVMASPLPLDWIRQLQGQGARPTGTFIYAPRSPSPEGYSL
jgi:hypothetical protein